MRSRYYFNVMMNYFLEIVAIFIMVLILYAGAMGIGNMLGLRGIMGLATILSLGIGLGFGFLLDEHMRLYRKWLMNEERRRIRRRHRQNRMEITKAEWIVMDSAKDFNSRYYILNKYR